VQLSVKYENVLNMTTAKALGLDVPTSMLLSADELIEREYRNARRLDRRRQQWVICDRGDRSHTIVYVRFAPKSGQIGRRLALCPVLLESGHGTCIGDCRVSPP
jgi:hypothetical protein